MLKLTRILGIGSVVLVGLMAALFIVSGAGTPFTIMFFGAAVFSRVGLCLLPWAAIAAWGASRPARSPERRAAWVAVIVTGLGLCAFAYEVDEPVARLWLIESVGLPLWPIVGLVLRGMSSLGLSRWRIELVETPLILLGLIGNPILWYCGLLWAARRSSRLRRQLLACDA